MFKSKKNRIYFDHASSTKPDVKVVDSFFFTLPVFGNSGAYHEEGRIAREALSLAREEIEKLLYIHNDEFIFTSSATESNELALYHLSKKAKTKNVIVSAIEHNSVYKACEKLNLNIIECRSDANGEIDYEHLENLIKDNDAIVSIIHGSNETGVLNDLDRVFKIRRNILKEKSKKEIYIHSDMSQSFQFIETDFRKLHVDAATISSHKMYGLKGVAGLFLRRTVHSHVSDHESQEFGFRDGTENVPLCVSFAKTIKLANDQRKKLSQKIIELRKYLIMEVKEKIPKIQIHTSANAYLPHIVHLSIPNTESDQLVIELDVAGISVSSQSACSRNELTMKKINALGLKKDNGYIRVSFGKKSTKKEVDKFISELSNILEKIS